MHRVHSSVDLYNVTGRMNFNDPCLQNIPRDFDISLESLANELDAGSSEELITEHDASAFFLEKINDAPPQCQLANCVSIRTAFVPSASEQVLLSADYCQLELRIIANLCKDDTLVKILNDRDNDVFILLASKWLGLPPSEIDEEKRQNVKKVTVQTFVLERKREKKALILNLNA